MMISEHLSRYRDIARLFWKYGRADIVRSARIESSFEDEDPPEAENSKPEELASDLEDLGPSFIKVGQLLSTRPDLLPPAYLQGLSRLQDKVKPFSYEKVLEIVEGELGVRMSKAFANFEAKPVAAASLGQVHRASLRDDRKVAVKVQRPNIRKEILTDLEIFKDFADKLEQYTDFGKRYQLSQLSEEFRRTLTAELDYRKEAQNMRVIGENLAGYPLIVVPQPIDDYTTSKVLTMEYIRGKKISAIGPLAPLEIEGEKLAEELFKAYLQQILVDGIFHADPHPGNVFLMDDGRIALIDLGMVAHISSETQERLLKLILAIAEGQGEEAADRAIQMSQLMEDFNEKAFRRQIADVIMRDQKSSLRQIEVGRTIMEVAWMAGKNGLRLPTELAILGKTLLHLEKVGDVLDPDFDPHASVRRNASRILQKRMYQDTSPTNLLSSLMETREFVQRLPLRINKILDQVANDGFSMKIDAIDERELINGLQKIANRITMGLILAALIVGAAMLMQVETTFTILGYPGLAIIFFIFAAGCGLALLLSIFLSDRN